MQKENISNKTGLDSALDWDYVGFWPRFLATAVDFVMVSAIVTPILIAIYGTTYIGDGRLTIQGTWHIIIGVIAPIAAAMWFLFKYQATPGKLMIRTQIVRDDNGMKPRRAQFIWRYLSFSLLSLPILGLGCLWVLFDKRKQSWHDKIAGTVVIKRP